MTMRDTIALELVDSHGQVRTSQCHEVLALVWAVDDDQTAKAIEHLRHALWPYWYLFQITEVRQLPSGGRCPLRQDNPAPLMRLLENGQFPLIDWPDLLSGSPHPEPLTSEPSDTVPGPADSCGYFGARGAVQGGRSPSRSDAEGALDGDERPDPDQAVGPGSTGPNSGLTKLGRIQSSPGEIHRSSSPLASALREQWMWVLVPPGAEFGALTSQAADGADVGRVARDAHGGDALPCI